MITVISGTNRPASRTLLFATHFQRQLEALGASTRLLDLAELNLSHFIPEMYNAAEMAPELRELQQHYVLEAEKLAIFVPEYNGSYPGVLKLFLDGISVNAYSQNVKGKVIALVGIATGRAGNLRGMDHLADTIAHMGGWVLPNKLPISGVEHLLTDGRLNDAATEKALLRHAEQLIAAHH
ncbi:NAD(P)H-dependent oxidoreductase [Neolewinella lacunae]|uniref:NAD(P)H-dependent oxidoreductase n=1 Tax=Neolewinella lacunae TaxID=1517758 RepID=A0A923PLP7_9BACT|nr:NAD(P)H-dependent oxidoreductase [Neolewinella lacunae]MBC6993589.1 NAD(P)H-dependent oxidoreductase [Neolewinella lacunae]MDN3633479.1 NAD(P)H-dependent oxidoreductase [Neolewinella lacunae]